MVATEDKWSHRWQLYDNNMTIIYKSTQGRDSLLVILFDGNSDFIDLFDSEQCGDAERSDDGLGVKPLLHVWL